jgi:hypothetical protein
MLGFHVAQNSILASIEANNEKNIHPTKFDDFYTMYTRCR